MRFIKNLQKDKKKTNYSLLKMWAVMLCAKNYNQNIQKIKNVLKEFNIKPLYITTKNSNNVYILGYY